MIERLSSLRLVRDPGTVFWLAWHAGALAVVLLGPLHPTAQRAVAGDEIGFALLLAVAFLAVAFSLAILAGRPGGVSLLTAVVVGAFCYVAAALIAVRRPDLRCTDPGCLVAAALGPVLAFLPYLAERRRHLATVALALSLVGVASAPRFESPPPVSERRAVNSALKTIAITLHHNLIPPPVMDGGAIDAHGDSLILVTGDGLFYRLTPDRDATSLRSERLNVAPPIDREGYLKDQPDLQGAPRERRLRVTDLLLEDRGDRTTAYVAHQYWNSADRCYTMRVSSAVIDLGPAPRPTAASEWRSIFETWPCLPFGKSFDSAETGGRLARLGEELLFTVGDHGFDGRYGPVFAQMDDNAYGKVFAVAPSGTHRVFTIGHRNPQGLLVDRQQRVWLTEHGPQGGDEINRLEVGHNYGWPYATYGTDYGYRFWPLAPLGRNHGTYTEPVHAFVPSIAISNLIQITSDLFPEWRDDLLIGSLRPGTLYRVRMRDDRVTYVEPIVVRREIRDLTQGPGGHLFMWNDGGDIMTLSPVSDETAIGAAAFERCRTCHQSTTTSPPVAPTLQGVLGRAVGSVPGYRYSAALSALGGVWSDDRLDTFLSDPAGYAPGSEMDQGRVPDPAERKALIEFLKRTAEREAAN